MFNVSKAHGALFGAAVGDALGAPLEFLSPKTEYNFVKDYVGGGVRELPLPKGKGFLDRH